MCNDTNQAINITETNIPEYDIKLLIQKITQLIPVQVHFQWIKGHQNELNNGERIHGPFPRLVQTNIEMDTKAAEAILIAKSIQIKRPTYCTTKLGLYNKNNEFVYDIREQLLYNNRYNDLWTYLKDKNKWEEEQMKCIQWRPLFEALGKYLPQYQTRIMQLIHNWQYVGERKVLMKDG